MLSKYIEYILQHCMSLDIFKKHDIITLNSHYVSLNLFNGIHKQYKYIQYVKFSNDTEIMFTLKKHLQLQNFF